jgi:hypothetical protein
MFEMPGLLKSCITLLNIMPVLVPNTFDPKLKRRFHRIINGLPFQVAAVHTSKPNFDHVDIRAVYTAQEKPRSDRDHIHIGSPLPK